MDLDTWFVKNHGVGISHFFQEEIKWTPEERKEEIRIWFEYAAEHMPPFYPGFLEMMRRFVAAGGILVVCSHSAEHMIRAHYEKQGGGLMPAAIYGWVEDRSKMKPNPFPVLDVMQRFGLKREDIAVLDDLSPGIQMAKAAGVTSCAAGWGDGHKVKVIHDDMKALCDYYFDSVSQFEDFIFQKSPPNAVGSPNVV